MTNQSHVTGQRHDLSRAVDQDGDVVDVYLQTRRDAEAALPVASECPQAELQQQFVGDPLFAPERILGRHAPDQLAQCQRISVSA
jgi:hypothetical protein